MNIDTITAQCFIAVSDTGSFTRAAKIVGRTQSAVSQQIAKLEDLLGKQLFNRGKDLTLTNDGEVFLNYARQIFKLHREAIERFKDPELDGEVSFGIPEDFASVFLQDVLKEFMQIHPRISLNIECDLTMNLYRSFKEGGLDLAVVKMECPDEESNKVELSLEKLSWAGNKNLTAIKQESIPLVLSPHPCVYREAAINALDQNHIKWHIAFSSHSYTGKIAAIKAGLGITVLPNKMIPKDLDIIENKTLPKLHDSHVTLLKNSDNNPAINSFADFVIQHLR